MCVHKLGLAVHSLPEGFGVAAFAAVQELSSMASWVGHPFHWQTKLALLNAGQSSQNPTISAAVPISSEQLALYADILPCVPDCAHGARAGAISLSHCQSWR